MAIGLDGFGPAEEFTVEDLERMPDDGLRYELLDGTLLVSPAPLVWHQEVAGTLYRLLYDACPPELHVVIAPFEWRGNRRTALQPDVLVARCGDLLAVEGGKFLATLPVLAVEVLSPSSQRIDRLSKLSVYEDAGVASYWLVDPDPIRPVGPADTSKSVVPRASTPGRRSDRFQSPSVRRTSSLACAGRLRLVPAFGDRPYEPASASARCPSPG